MSKVKHKLRLRLTWDYPRGENEFAQFMNKALITSIHDALKDAHDTNNRMYTFNNLLGDGGRWGTRLDIDFDMRTDLNDSWKDNLKDKAKSINFNNLTKVLHAIDAVMTTIPKECNPKALLSCLDYRSPWIQGIVTDGDISSLLVKDKTKVFDIKPVHSFAMFNPGIGYSKALESIRVIGEPVIAAKLKRTIEYSSNINDYTLSREISRLYTHETNSNWAIIVTSCAGDKWVYSYANSTRAPVFQSTIDLLKQPFKLIEHKYPNQPNFGADLKIFDV